MGNEAKLKAFQVEVTCTLCLEYFEAPRLLDCGHSFCHHCIFKYWTDFLFTSSCPECKMTTESRNLLPNRGLESFVKAVRWLEADLDSERERVCKKHQRPISSFCKGDKAPLCTACVDSGEHQTHEVVPLEQAFEELKDYFLTCIDTVRSRMELLYSNKTEVDKEGDLLLKSMQMEKERMVAKFNDLHASLLSLEHYFMRKFQDAELDFIQKRDKEMESIFRGITFHQKVVHDLQEKRYQPPTELVQDVGSLIERYEHTNVAPCGKPFSFKYLWQLWDFQDQNAFLECAIQEFKYNLGYPAIMLQEEPVTMDPKTAHPWLLLSEDLKSVRFGDAPQEMTESPEEFDPTLSVLGRDGFNVGRKYWDVEVGSEGDWAVGVATKPPKKKKAKCSRARIHALGKLDGQYQYFCPSGDDDVNCSVELRRVRVTLNCLGKYVTFFDVDGGGLVHQAALPPAREGLLFPYFQVGRKAALTLAPPGPPGC